MSLLDDRDKVLCIVSLFGASDVTPLFASMMSIDKGVLVGCYNGPDIHP